jgi:ABC-type polysaccharide/polyol phosphate export permease
MDNLNKNAVNNGFIIAIITIAIQLLTYYAAPAMLGATWFGIATGLIILVIYILLTIDLRKKIGGFWSFKQALTGIFIMSLVANVTSSVFNFIFYKFIEPNAYDKVKGYVAEGLTATLEKMGMSGADMDKAIEKATESLKAQYQPSPLDFLKNIVIAILIGFVMSLIFAAIFKKNPPMFAPIEEAE